MATAAQIRRLRRLVGDRIPQGGTDQDTFWSDTELGEIYDEKKTYEAAAYECWREKAGEYARLIDISDSGVDRKLSQKHTNANRMVETYRKAIADGATAGSALRVVGIAMNLDESDDEEIYIPEEFYQYTGDGNIRYYPLKRMPSVLR